MGSARRPQGADDPCPSLLDEAPLLTIMFTAPVPGVLLVTVDGELDIASAPELDARLRHEMHERRPSHVILDLARLRFLGLHGIAVFERLRRRSLAAGCGVALASLPPAGRRALEFAGILSLFDRYPDAITALGWKPTEAPRAVRTTAPAAGRVPVDV